MSRLFDRFVSFYFPYTFFSTLVFLVIWVYLTREQAQFPEWGFVLVGVWVVSVVPSLPLIVLMIVQEKIQRLKDEAEFQRDCYTIRYCDDDCVTTGEVAVETENPYQSPVCE